ncbi:MAG: hypothetical protein ACLQPD_03380 [Desulfomonilaceae bacterium]
MEAFMKKTLSANLKDIRGVTFTCKNCDHAMSFKPTNWNVLPSACPNCGSKESAFTEKQCESLNFFRRDLRAICEGAKDFPFDVTLIFDE